MMGLSSRDALNIVELTFYVPALGLSIWVLLKHGFGRQAGWVYLAILGLVRIIGASTGLAAINNHSTGLVQASFVCYGIGLSPLLFAMLGIVKRVNEGMHSKGVPPKYMGYLSIPLLVGLILGIVGSTKAFDSNPNGRSSSSSYIKAAVILYALALVALSAIAMFNLARQHSMIEGEKRLALAVAASIPFLIVRILYSIISAFDRSSKVFKSTSNSTTAVIVQAIMSSTMEFIVVIIYLAAGFAVGRIPRSMVKKGYIDGAREASIPLRSGKTTDGREYSPMALEDQHIGVINDGQRTQQGYTGV